MKKRLKDIWSFDGGFIEMDMFTTHDEAEKSAMANTLSSSQYQQLTTQQNNCLLQHPCQDPKGTKEYK